MLSSICRLESPVEKDAIRNRMAMVFLDLELKRIYLERKLAQARVKTRVKRGYIICMIDKVLENTHAGWRTAGNRARAAIQAHFYNQQQYRKPWWTLVNGLGYDILFLCLSRLVGIMYCLYLKLGRVIALLTPNYRRNISR